MVFVPKPEAGARQEVEMSVSFLFLMRDRKKMQRITYGPHKAVAEVSNHNEPIGSVCVASVRKAIDVRLTQVADQVAWLSTDFDCQLI